MSVSSSPGTYDRPRPAPPGRRRPAPAGVDPAAWPDVARVPRDVAAAHGRCPGCWWAGRWPGCRCACARPDGSVTGGGGPVLRLRDPKAFFRRLGADGLIGFGESYMAGDWDADDLAGVLTVLAAHVGRPGAGAAAAAARRCGPRRRPGGAAQHPPTAPGSNIHRHYDLSNDLFALFLDETMTYSSALFDVAARRAGTLLAAAQHRKIDRLLDLAGVGAGTRLLEIGTGWGELALRAADRGAEVRDGHAVRRAARPGRRPGRGGRPSRTGSRSSCATTATCEGGYDAVVSVEMIEAVGERVLAGVLRDARPAARPRRPDRPPGDHHAARPAAGHPRHPHLDPQVHLPRRALPSAEAIEQTSPRAHGAADRGDRPASGAHYAETLRLWRERFDAHAPTRRRARASTRRSAGCGSFYLAYCEAGFRSGYLDVHQMALERLAGPGPGGGRRPEAAPATATAAPPTLRPAGRPRHGPRGRGGGAR